MNRWNRVSFIFGVICLVLAIASPVVPAQEGTVLEGDADGVRLSLEQALRTALEFNLDLVSARYTPEIQEARVGNSDAPFDPVFNLDFLRFENAQPPIGVFSVTDTDADRLRPVRFTQQMKWGGSYDVGWRLRREAQAGPQVAAASQFYSEFSAQLTVPLLKGLGKTANTVELARARTNHEVSKADLEIQAQTTIETVEGAYWDIVAARANVRVKRFALKRAEDLLELNKKKVDVGTLAPIEITQAEAGVASNEEGVIVAVVTLEDAEDELRRLLAIPDGDRMWIQRIVPTDRPSFDERNVDLEAAIGTALENRSEMDSSRHTLSFNELNQRAAKRNVRNQLDLVAAYNPTGTDFDVVTPPESASLGQAIGNTFDGDAFTWSVQLVYTMPLKNRDAKSTYSQSNLSLAQAEVNLQNQEQKIRVEVRKAVRGVTSGIRRVEAAQKNKELQQEKLEAEEKKFENGMSTSFEVLTFQNDLADAELSLINAALDYTKSITGLERAKGTLLAARGLSIQD